MTSIGVDPAPGGLPDGTPEKTAAELTLELARAERRQARKEQWRLLRRRPGFIIGCLILLFWVVGSIAWFIAGRPQGQRPRRGPSHRPPPPRGPDDDPDFLRNL